MELEQIIRALMARANGPQMPTYAPGSQNGVPPLGGDEMTVGRPFPNEQMPQMAPAPGNQPSMPSGGFTPEIVGALTGQEPQVPSALRQRQASNMRGIGADGIPAGSEIVRALRAQPQLMDAPAGEFFSGIGFPTDEADALAQIDAMPPEERAAFYDYIMQDFTGDMEYSGDAPIQSILDGYSTSAQPANPAMDQFREMSVEEREAYLNELNGGASQPYDMSGPERLQPTQATPNLYTGDGIEDLGLNTTEGREFGFALRGQESHDIITQLEEQGTEFWSRMASGVPLVGNYLVDSDYQMYDQARRDFINATLRRESGAVISDAEFANAEQQYFPQPGDSPEVIAQKRRNRERAILAMRAGSGPGIAALPQMAEPQATGSIPDWSELNAAEQRAMVNRFGEDFLSQNWPGYGGATQ